LDNYDPPVTSGAELKDGSSRSPRLLPLTIALSLLFWIIATTGGRQVFVKEVLGDAYDSQAEHFLRGDPGVDLDAIRSEAMIVNGKVRMYFGPFPAFVRMPLNYVYPSGRGYWSRISGFCAGTIALAAFAGLVSTCLRSSQLSPRWRNWVGNACLLGFALGSPLLLLLGNLSIYHETIVWGLAWSLAALYFACRSRKAEGAVLTRSLLAFSFCVAGALLSRVTFGAPFLLIAPLLALRLLRRKQIANLVALFLPLGAALLFHLSLSYAKFGTFSGEGYKFYINPTHREFARKYGVFRLERTPYSSADYFILRRPELQHGPPFLSTRRHPYNYPSLFSLPFSETYSSLLWCSPWITLGAIMGVGLLLRSKSSDGIDRAIAIALFFQLICILSYFALAQRYTAELYPFLVFCFLIFLRSGGTILFRLRYAVVGLVAVSVVINSLATTSWHAADPYTPIETRTFWNMLVGKTVRR
jgi:hypothetical protein